MHPQYLRQPTCKSGFKMAHPCKMPHPGCPRTPKISGHPQDVVPGRPKISRHPQGLVPGRPKISGHPPRCPRTPQNLRTPLRCSKDLRIPPKYPRTPQISGHLPSQMPLESYFHPRKACPHRRGKTGLTGWTRSPRRTHARQITSPEV